eukprot:TRINITY_DN1020_c0_g1_i3.p1 TRINITY_DN1020_c0_g1~~TRINITY_DN1020_c0_g1_i3.p1  ORF type:complete len:414 (+),score=89.30 TRINITY_DN1020_c0_g1_i3:356-1597(+)
MKIEKIVLVEKTKQETKQQLASFEQHYHHNTMYKRGPYTKSEWTHPPTSLASVLEKVGESSVKEVTDFDPSHHKIISLNAILSKDKDEMHQLDELLVKRGWAFVDLSLDEKAVLQRRGIFQEVIFPFIGGNAFSELAAFFGLSEEKKAAVKEYSSVPHLKENVHLITHNLKSGVDRYFPALKTVCPMLDELVMAIMQSFFCEVLGIRPNTLAHRADLPVGFGSQKGMLDIVNYLNEKTSIDSPPIGNNTDEVNCVAHFDPGLFSLSFLSTSEGLQLLDLSTNTWFAGPINSKPGQENIGVLWLGDAAVFVSKGRWKPAVHRVVYPRVSVPRLTAWYEVCTVEQINNDDVESPYAAGPLSIPNIGDSSSVVVQEGDTPKQVAQKIQRHFGIPMSKIRRSQDSFAAYRSEDRKLE